MILRRSQKVEHQLRRKDRILLHPLISAVHALGRGTQNDCDLCALSRVRYQDGCSKILYELFAVSGSEWARCEPIELNSQIKRLHLQDQEAWHVISPCG